MKRGTGYLGSKQIETSTENMEVIPESPISWTIPYSLYKFSFRNYDPCSVVINNETEIYLDTGDGFEMAETDKPITSFIIVQPGVRYNWRGGY